MNIQQLSATIDQKLLQLEQQIRAQQQQLLQAGNDHEQIRNDIAALTQLKAKLEKSRDIAWRAHQLQRDGDEKLLRQKRWLGLALCAVSGIGLLVIGAIILLR